MGLRLASIVVILDVSKAIIVIFIASLFLNGEPLIKAIGAIFVILGHIWPITAKLRGGKGVLTGIVGLIILSPLSGVPSFILAVLTISVFKIVSLGSIVGTMASVIAILVLYLLGQEKNIEYVAYVIIGSIFILFKHTDNIKRLISKTEPKIGNSAKKQKNDD